MLRTALVILSGNAAASLLSLARNLLVARLLPVADYGVAATLAIVMSVVEMVSAFGLQQQIVQSRDGDDPRFQAALQGFQLLRGVGTALLLLAIAEPAAHFLGVPDAAWGYRIMALVPVLNALVHFDVYRLNRHMTFGPMIWSGVLPNVASLLAVWPLALWLGDWRVMLGAILVQATLTPLVAILLAHRPFHLSFDHVVIGQSMRFGWPLLLNNVLMFFVFNGDRVIVGRLLGMEALAIFSLGLTLTLTPTLVLTKSAQNLFLPVLSSLDRATPGGEAKFQDIATTASHLHLALGMGLVLVTAALGELAVQALLGPRYSAVASLLPWLALLQAVRIVKGGPSMVAFAGGQSGNAAAANALRIVALPLGWVAASESERIVAVIVASLLGELAGACLSFALLRWRTRVLLGPLVWPCALGVASCAFALAAALQDGSVVLVLLALSAAAFGLALSRMRGLRRFAASRLAGHRPSE